MMRNVMVAGPSDKFGANLVASTDLPLWGKHVMITTPRNYAGTLGRLLLLRGARCIWMPTIEIGPLEDTAELDAAIARLCDYDWIAFTSENGVRPFCDRFAALGHSAASLGKTKLAAFAADARLLGEYGLHADLVPGPVGPRGIIDELARGSAAGGRVLVPCPQVSGVEEPYVIPEFIDGLARIGMTPVRLETYRTVAVEDGDSLEHAMLANGEIDCLVFTSSAEITSLLKRLNGNTGVLERLPLAYMGSYTAATGHKLGLSLDIVPDRFTMPDLVEGIEAHFLQSA